MRDTPYIGLDQCKQGSLYRLDARRMVIGIFDSDSKSFLGPRHKWGSTFLSREYHWDTGAPYGTAKPVEEILEAPPNSFVISEGDHALLKWLLDLIERLGIR